MLFRSISASCILLAGYSAGFQATTTTRVGQPTALGSYMDDLSGGAATTAAPVRSNWAPWSGIKTPTPVAAPSAQTTTADPSIGGGIHHASLEYFGLDQLASKGPRATKDWGTPQDATRGLANDGMLRAGAWFCSEGGWPSPNEKAHTEIFYVLDGHGMLGDSDGAKHYFGPGDIVIIPKGHSGRWDVNAAIHKIWAVNAHDEIVEDRSQPIRVRVDGYHTFAPHLMTSNKVGSMDPLYAAAAPEISHRTIYDIGPTTVGVWASERAFIPISVPLRKKTFFYLMEGKLSLHDLNTKATQLCVPGDTVMLPEGFQGYIDVLEPAKKLFTTAV